MSWKVGDRDARVQNGGWIGMILPASPSAGLELSNEDWLDRMWRLVTINPNPRHSCTIEERYLREGDYIVRYKQTDKDKFSFQIDWREITPELDSNFEFGVEMWISVQTALLNVQPTIELTSEVGGASWETIHHRQLVGSSNDAAVPAEKPPAPAAMIARTDSGTVVQLVHPSDQEQVEYQEVKRKSVRSMRLFGQSMEKGVIRRARVRIMATIEEVDLSRVTESYQRFQDSPLPLTT